MVNVFDVKLPDDLNHLKLMYLVVSKIINNIWIEYTCYCEAINSIPQTSLIFPIIFNELDFYESLLARIGSHIPEDLLNELKHEEHFWHW